MLSCAIGPAAAAAAAANDMQVESENEFICPNLPRCFVRPPFGSARQLVDQTAQTAVE